MNDDKENSPKRPLLVVNSSVLAESLHKRKGGCMVRNTRQWLYCLVALVVVVIVYRWLIGRAPYDYSAELGDFDKQRGKVSYLFV
jgi:hypothetical protein